MTRPEPPLTQRTAPYWQSGRDGMLRLATCQACGWRMHPPRPLCAKCHSTEVAFAPVSGKGVVYSWTINRYPWSKNMAPPYLVAEIELAEQPDLHLTSNLVDCPLDAVRIGMPVEVTFDHVGEAWIPDFRPC